MITDFRFFSNVSPVNNISWTNTQIDPSECPGVEIKIISISFQNFSLKRSLINTSAGSHEKPIWSIKIEKLRFGSLMLNEHSSLEMTLLDYNSISDSNPTIWSKCS
jgi:hypothetical protein